MNDRSRSSPDRCTTADRQNQTAAKRIGLFGGTFNPIHLGHLRGAEEIYEAFHLNSVIFVPALIPPHKNAEGMIAPEHRLAMVRAAIENNQAFSVSDFELRQDRISYSVLTIQHFREQLGTHSELFFIMGMDSFREITTWKDYARLFELASFIMLCRPGYQGVSPSDILPVDEAVKFEYNSVRRCFQHYSGNCLFFPETTRLDISSRSIRAKIKNRQSIRYLVSPEVEDYIMRHDLYQV